MKTKKRTSYKQVRILPKTSSARKSSAVKAEKTKSERHDVVPIQRSSIRVSEETINILKTVQYATKCSTHNTTIDTILTAIEKLKKRPRLPALRIQWGQRFMRIDNRLVARIAALKLGETTNRALYEAARLYLMTAGS